MNSSFFAIIDGEANNVYIKKKLLTVGNQIQFKSHLDFQNNPKLLP